MVSGELVVDKELITINSINTVNNGYIHPDGCDAFAFVYDIYPLQNPLLQADQYCDRLKFKKSHIWTGGNSEPNVFAINSNQVHIKLSYNLLGVTDYTQETTATLKNKFNEYLDENPVTLTIPIQPLTYQLTPQEIKTLLGENHLFADTGSINMDYRADTKRYIDDIRSSLQSELSEKVGFEDYATGDKAGVVKVQGSGYSRGVINVGNGIIGVDPATSSNIKNAAAVNKPIIPPRQHESTFYGLAKAAGDTTQSASNNAVGTYTDNAKTAIKSMLGVETTVNVSGTTPTITAAANSSESRVFR